MPTEQITVGQFMAMQEKLQTLSKVLTTRAPIAQTPKEVVWTLTGQRVSLAELPRLQPGLRGALAPR